MLRYEYKNLFDSTIPICKDCLLFEDCRNFSIKQNNEFGPCMYGIFERKNPDVSSKNADWILFQIRRQATLSKQTAETLIRNHRMNWAKPISLQDNMTDKPSVVECITFRTAMEATIKFLWDKKKEFDSLKRDNDSARRRFVHSFIDTYVEVKEEEIKVKSFNTDFIDFLKKFIKDENYTLIIDRTYKVEKNERNKLRKRIEATAS